MTIEQIANELEFEPQHRQTFGGNELQIATTSYKNVLITERTYIPYNWFKQIRVTFLVDHVIAENTVLKNGIINYNCYTEDGFGIPQFNELEHAIEYIDTIKYTLF
jgi:hypothetical protein